MTEIITFATTKGGTGKTTLVACLSTYWQKSGLKVSALDADPNANLLRWFEKGNIENIKVKLETDESAIIDTVNEISTEQDLVLIDVAGFANQAMIYAIGMSDLVIIPSRPAEDDVIEAIRTKQIVQNASKLTRREIPFKVVLTQITSNTLVLKHSRNQFEAFNIPLFSTEITNRTAFPNARYKGITPILNEPKSKASLEIIKLATEINDIIKTS